MKYSLGISNFLEEISSFSHSIVFLYFFALITEEGFLISPCHSIELCIQMGISFLFSFAFNLSSFLSYLQGLLSFLTNLSFLICRDDNSASSGTFLVVQWPRLCAPNAGGPGSSPGQGARSHKLKLRVCMLQLKIPTCHNKDQRSRVLQLRLDAAK